MICMYTCIHVAIKFKLQVYVYMESHTHAHTHKRMIYVFVRALSMFRNFSLARARTLSLSVCVFVFVCVESLVTGHLVFSKKCDLTLCLFSSLSLSRSVSHRSISLSFAFFSSVRPTLFALFSFFLNLQVIAGANVQALENTIKDNM